MSRLSKVFIGISAVLLVTFIAGFFFLRHLVTKSFPVTDGTLVVAGLHQVVDVYRDEYGVPHIQAQDEHDLAFATGYSQAQDRLWQMDILRRAGEGRLSEVLGKATVDFDLLFRTLDLNGVAQRIAEQLHPESKQLLQDFADGVNAFIATHRGKYPIEFDMLNYEPEPWKIQQSILVSRLIAWELNLAWWTDLTYGEISEKVPLQKLEEIFPTFPDSVRVTVPADAAKKKIAGVRDMMNISRSYRDYFGLGSLEAGSNGWVVDSSKSMSGKPLLANDPHLAMPAPSRWYEMHLTAPGCDVAGVSLPGTPVIIIGHNVHLAWGLTNAMLDDADFYVEHPDSGAANHYIVQKSSLPMTVREETILIDKSDSLSFVARSTHHGPIINDVHPLHQHHDRDTASELYRTPIAMRWTGLEVSDEMYGFYMMNRAHDYHEFERGLQELTVPGQAVVYADTRGNIAYWTTGRVPIRGKQNPMLPLPGWTGDAEWKGFVPFDQLPKLINPPSGFIACANQKIADRSFPYYLSTLWEPPSRIQRIEQLLRSASKFTGEDFEQFQKDDISFYARDITKHILQACTGDSTHVQDSSLSSALTYLRNWDFRFSQGDVATTIFNSFYVHLLHNTYEDEMGTDLFRDFVYFGAIPYRVTSQLLASPDSSSWFDDVTTPGRETRQDILRKSLLDAIKDLRASAGSEMKNWQWGTQHQVTFAHVFGSRKPLDKVFNIGPFPMGGGGTTLNRTEFRVMAPFAVSVGPSVREVIDLADSLSADMVITSGQSGQPLNDHYSDQTPLWLNGGYHRVTMDWNEIRKSHWEHLVLKPENKN